MPVGYRIDSEAGVVFVRGEGAITCADLERYCVGVVRDPAYRAGMHELADFRGARDGGLTPGDLYKLRDLNKSLADQLAPSRLAYVVDSDLGFGLARMFGALSEESPVDHAVFRELKEARAWLGLPPNPE